MKYYGFKLYPSYKLDEIAILQPHRPRFERVQKRKRDEGYEADDDEPQYKRIMVI